MSWFLDLFLGRKLKRETDQYVRKLAFLPSESSRENATKFLASLRAQSGPMVTLGETLWGEPVAVPLEEIMNAHSYVSGGTGSGKTMFVLSIVEELLDRARS